MGALGVEKPSLTPHATHNIEAMVAMIAALVARGHVHGAQFHPEKSAAAGRRLLANFFAP
jgi:imidazoleglycerol phosphate synthase glutamine amidotransferase subunit HisH